MTGEFPAQMASNAENVSIWGRHHDHHQCNWWLTPSSARTVVARVITKFGPLAQTGFIFKRFDIRLQHLSLTNYLVLGGHTITLPGAGWLIPHLWFILVGRALIIFWWGEIIQRAPWRLKSLTPLDCLLNGLLGLTAKKYQSVALSPAFFHRYRLGANTLQWRHNERDATFYSGTDETKHQSSASLAFVRGIHRWPVNSPHKGPVTRNMFPFDDVIMMLWKVYDESVKTKQVE